MSDNTAFVQKNSAFLAKYADIIAEEVNVKQVTPLSDDIHVTSTYIPLGQALGAPFGKDTARIIAAAKAGHAVVQGDHTLLVTDGKDQWTLTPEMYEIRYSGLTQESQTVEEGIILSLDLTVTEELKREGTVREMVRFLNQMRKDANLQIDAKVACQYHTDTSYLADIITEFTPLLCQEALLSELRSGTIDAKSDMRAVFTTDEGVVTFQLRS